MPNQQKGHAVELRTDHAQQQLDQYTKTREQIFSIDQERTEGPSWKQSLANPVIEKSESELEKTNAWKTTLEKDYTHLSAEQQERYTDLQRSIVPAGSSKDQEMEL